MKKIYAAPDAKIICLVPEEHIAELGWQNGSDRSWWTDGFFWNSSGFLANPDGASKVNWYDYGMDEINDPTTTTN